jgi:hypothetical protein
MNVEIGSEAAQLPEKQYINGDFRCSADSSPGHEHNTFKSDKMVTFWAIHTHI